MTRNFRCVVVTLLALAAPPLLAQVTDSRGNPDSGKLRGAEPGKVDAGRCNGPVCRLEVKVKGDCEIRVDPEWVFIGGKQVRIIWEIKTPGYSFEPVVGVRFKDEYNPQWRTQIFPSERDPQKAPNTWEMFDTNSQVGLAFRYAITVINERTRERCTADPGVVNDWP